MPIYQARFMMGLEGGGRGDGKLEAESIFPEDMRNAHTRIEYRRLDQMTISRPAY